MGIGEIISEIFEIGDRTDDYLKRQRSFPEKRALELHLLADMIAGTSGKRGHHEFGDDFDDDLEQELEDFSDDEECSSWLASMGVSEEEYDAMDEQEQQKLAFDYGYGFDG